MLHCEEGNLQEMSKILDNGILDLLIDSINENGLSLLAVAIKHHHLDLAQYLISHGANVNSLNKVSIQSYST